MIITMTANNNTEEDKNNEKQKPRKITALTVNPKESRLTGMYEMVQSRHQTDTIMNFVKEYTSLSRSI